MPEAPLRVLVVDDEAPARRRLRDLLDDCGAALPLTVVGEAQHGREALDLLQTAPADLVLTDIHMPDMDGIEFARHLLKLSHPPVVIFTTAFHEHAVQAFEVNAIDYLMKPVRVQRLLGALQKVPKLKPVADGEALAAADLGAALPLRDGAFPRRARSARRHRLPQGRAQVHHHPHRAARIPARGVADAARRRVRHRFVRVHRNCLVSRDFIRGFERRVNDDGDAHWEVLLNGVPESLPVSRRQQFVVRDVGRESVASVVWKLHSVAIASG